MKLANKIVQLAAIASLSSLSFAAEPGRWDSIKGYAHTEKEAAIADGKQVLADLDAKIEEMKKQAAHATRDGFANAYQDLHQAFDKATAAVKR